MNEFRNILRNKVNMEKSIDFYILAINNWKNNISKPFSSTKKHTLYT